MRRTMRQIKIGRRTGVGLVIAICAVALATPVAFASHATTTRTQASSASSTAMITAGYQIFNDYFCTSCHTLKAAGPASYGRLGMNFNHIHGPYAADVAVVTNGLPAALPLYPTQMLGFGKVLTTTQIEDVATFVAAYSGSYSPCAPCEGVTFTGFPDSSATT
jgi:mono/diheme cytochrome c family protein